MGPLIILDKSALQSLSQREIYRLFKHYFVVVPPILLVEILGDLQKEKKKDGFSRQEVVQLSHKLLSVDSAINTDYQTLCIGSLLGYSVPMDGRAAVSDGIPLKTRTGETGYFYDEPQERKALKNWKEGIFSQAEEALAKAWREATRALDLEGYNNKLREAFKGALKIKDLDELQSHVERFVSNPDPAAQLFCLTSLMDELSLPSELKNKISNRWLEHNLPLLKDFAPYAYYCAKVTISFYLGLAAGLMSTRSTSRIDLEYFYYLPFCMVFSSRDRFHKRVCRLFLRQDQTFVDGDVLKKDLRGLADEWEGLSPEERVTREYEYGIYPPENSGSITHQLWVKYMRPWRSGAGNRAVKMTQEETKKLMEQLKPMIEAVKEYKRENR